MSAHEPSAPKRIALLGCGTVGREVAARLIESGERLGAELVRVLVRDTARDRGLPRDLFTASIEDIDAARPDLVVELIGGLEPACALVSRFLSRGITVITANKTLIARRGRELGALAHDQHAELAYEAAACAAIPVFAALRHLRGDRILSIRGIVNGSCNFILSRLADGWRFDDALTEAKKRGLVEPDPSADVSGRDSAEKLAILAAAAGCPLDPDRIETRGIESLTPEDLTAARRSGRTIKLLAELDLTGESPRARVGPTLIPRAHNLAQVEDEENALVIESELGGELVLKGRGAGPRPTASAILGDVARMISAPVRPGALAAPEPTQSPRRHVRLAGPDIDAALRMARQAHAYEVHLTRAGARLECGCAPWAPHADALVLPILE